MLLRMHPFLLLSFVLTSIPLPSSSDISPSALDNEGLTCGSIPYQFGTAGIALPGFEIDCPKEEPWKAIPSLNISNNTYTIQQISLLHGYIKIFVGPIHKWCFGANGKLTEYEGTGQFNLDNTPFALSHKYNTLTVVGCNNLVLISTQGKNLTVTSGCVTFCDPHGAFPGGSCSGLGCCQATLPGNLKSFDLKFQQANPNSSAASINCSAAFFSQRDDFQSDKNGFLFHDFNIYDTSFYNNNLIQLEWAIGNKYCEAAKNESTGSFACKKNSDCYDSPSMVGYLCNCSQGYKGNPYAEDGCTDIDECLESVSIYQDIIHVLAQ